MGEGARIMDRDRGGTLGKNSATDAQEDGREGPEGGYVRYRILR